VNLFCKDQALFFSICDRAIFFWKSGKQEKYEYEIFEFNAFRYISVFLLVFAVSVYYRYSTLVFSASAKRDFSMGKWVSIDKFNFRLIHL
jgi:hypothetical protein